MFYQNWFELTVIFFGGRYKDPSFWSLVHRPDFLCTLSFKLFHPFRLSPPFLLSTATSKSCTRWNVVHVSHLHKVERCFMSHVYEVKGSPVSCPTSHLHKVQMFFSYCHSSGAVWESRWPSWAVRPNEPSGFRGRKDLLNHASALVSVCP